MKKFIFACTLLLIFACASTKNYVPKQFQSASEAKLIILRFLREQPPKFAPHDIEIADNYLRTEHYANPVKALARVPTITYIYYSSIGDIKLYYKNGIYRIFVFDKDGTRVRRRYYSSSESRSKELIDALYTLKMGLGIP